MHLELIVIFSSYPVNYSMANAVGAHFVLLLLKMFIQFYRVK